MSRASQDLSDINSHIFWAAIDYHRWWLTFDQIELWRQRETGGRLTAQSIRRIGSAYLVNRGIRQLERDEGARRLADKLNVISWPQGFAERSDCCVRLAQWAAETIVSGETITKGHQVSAMTKLMWFLHPTGWTLFDRFVAKAVGVPAHLPRPEQARRYYQALKNHGFETYASDANACVDTTLFPDFRSERVLDRYLMIKGGLYGQQLSELPLVLKGYLRGLGSETSGALIDLAGRLQDTLGPDPMHVYERAA